MHNLHYTLASLPEIVPNKQKTLIDWEELTDILFNALSKSGKKQLQIIYLQRKINEIEKAANTDLGQTLNINSTLHKLPPFSRFTIDELTQTNSTQQKLRCLSQLKDAALSLSIYSKESLLKKWTEFEYNVDVVCLALYCQKIGREPGMEQLFKTHFVKTVFHSQSTATKNAKAEFPYSSDITAKFDKLHYSEFENYILQLKWDFINSITDIEPFSTDSAISYCIKHILFNRKVEIENSFDSGRFDLKLLS